MMDETLRAYVQAGIDAGLLILDLRAHMDEWAHKSDGSPVTVADEQAEDLILARLAVIDPDTPVVAEESVAAGKGVPSPGRRFYLVDPLDGTREFVKGRSAFTVNIGLIEDSIPTLGVIVAPAMAEGFAADADGVFRFRVVDGAAADIEPIQARRPGEKLDVVVSQSHLSAETRRYLDKFQIGERKSFGSSLKFCRVAEGAVDFYPRLGRTMEWDTAAGDAILRRAGGSVRTLDGAPLRYGKIDNQDDEPYANTSFVAFGDWPDSMIRRK
jgi:3'(2'), 5'-bisphosphate nucleotidase